MFCLCTPGRTGDGGSASAGDSTRDDTFRSLFSNRLDDFMDSTSSTGDIFPPPLASSRSGTLGAQSVLSTKERNDPRNCLF